ncbi:GNAT family N-acetyltransferase [Streptomyces sp. NBC_01281]|uniref:GNAT family N-acetyltransferase n=1 Tax=Streptomyces sp. NBC_01281 TaxID=2903811 RepID=UPI002E126D3A
MPAGTSWDGRRLIALVGNAVGGHLDFLVHPDRQALSVWGLEVRPDFQRHGLATLLMDALYAAHPRAWINHGQRLDAGTWWWNSYRDPAPERNIHNVAPQRWARYFNALDVAAEKAQNDHSNDFFGLDGHKGAVYRYGERLEEEAGLWIHDLWEGPPEGIDPSAQRLHGAVRLLLPTSLHAYIHDAAHDGAARAAAVLDYIGHGSLPRGYWNTSLHAAFEDVHHDELFQDAASVRPATHMVFTLHPLAEPGSLPDYDARPTHLDFLGSADIAVELAGMAWRLPGQPWTTHTAEFAPPVAAAIPPRGRQHASAAYRARYDETGFLLPHTDAQPDTAHPYADRAGEIRDFADRLQRDVAARAGPPQSPEPAPMPLDRRPLPPPMQHQPPGQRP